MTLRVCESGNRQALEFQAWAERHFKDIDTRLSELGDLNAYSTFENLDFQHLCTGVLL